MMMMIKMMTMMVHWTDAIFYLLQNHAEALKLKKEAYFPYKTHNGMSI